MNKLLTIQFQLANWMLNQQVRVLHVNVIVLKFDFWFLLQCFTFNPTGKNGKNYAKCAQCNTKLHLYCFS